MAKDKNQQPVPEIDESLLTPAQKAEMEAKRLSKGWIIFFAVMLTLILGCVLAIIFIPA